MGKQIVLINQMNTTSCVVAPEKLISHVKTEVVYTLNLCPLGDDCKYLWCYNRHLICTIKITSSLLIFPAGKISIVSSLLTFPVGTISIVSSILIFPMGTISIVSSILIFPAGTISIAAQLAFPVGRISIVSSLLIFQASKICIDDDTHVQ